MPWDVPADPLRFREAEEWFRDRLALTREEWEELDAKARRKAFFVSNVAQARVVADAHNALTRGLAEGKSLTEIKADISPALQEAWGGTVANPAHRLDTIARTNVQSAYAAGRERLASHPTVQRLRPFARFDAVEDHRTSELCGPLNGTVKAVDDPWWDNHTPPLHFSCRSGKVFLTEEQARAEGITETDPDTEAQEGFGTRPDQSEWEPSQGDLPDDLWASLHEKLQ